ncbi:MAG: lipoyl synthase [Spirochaetia bacterium]|nr:lipoyl synthase [Spirochaetia bacterium]
MRSQEKLPKPEWIRIRPPSGPVYQELRGNLKLKNLHTVCQEALCPNIGECWSSGTATIMILGDTCTRGCRFCNVKSGNPKGVVDLEEPVRVAEQIQDSNLKYLVLTCVDRDDLPDGGAFIFAETVSEIKKRRPDIRVETLISDYSGKRESLEKVMSSGPDVIAHNVETIRRLTPTVRDPRASFDQSLELLRRVKEIDPKRLSKSSVMIGLGETLEEALACASELRQAGVDIVTFGQDLRPSAKHLPVVRYAAPAEFEELEKRAREMGFLFVASGPFVRSSYRAAELFIHGHLEKKPSVGAAP